MINKGVIIMAGIQTVFERTEKKYVISEEQYKSILSAMQQKTEKDQYGEYTICNIYYDTENYELVRHSIEKPVFKEKLRMRSYGTPQPDSPVFLEIKRKFNGTVYKRRITLPYEEMMRFVETGEYPYPDNQVQKEIDFFIKSYSPKPKVYLAYDREAYVGTDDAALRITFDSNIRSRESELSLSAGDYGTVLLDKSRKVMEIKTDSAFPVWLCSALNENNIFPASFSKYGSVYVSKLLSVKENLLCSQV